MKNSRTINSIRNTSVGIAVTVGTVLLSFVTRVFFLRTLGEDYLGLNGLFTEIITVLSLAELGVGMAIIYHLYLPIEQNDKKRINQLMTLYKKTYNTIGMVVLVVGICITPFVELLVTDVDFPVSYIRKIFLLFVFNSAVSYFFSYRTSLLTADQKQYILSIITLVVKVICTVTIIIALLLTHNYILYLCLLIAQSMLINIVASIYVSRAYPFLDYRDTMSKEEMSVIFKDIKDIFLKKLSGVVTSSTDNILISKLVSTIKVGLYSNYTMLFTGVRMFTGQISNGIRGSVGNLMVTEDGEHCSDVLKKTTFIYYMYAIVVSAGLLAISSDFVAIVFGEKYILEYYVIIIAIANIYLEICCDPLWQYMEVSGLFSFDKYIGIIGSIVNLIISIVLGRIVGMAGIFLGTISTQLIQITLKSILLYDKKLMVSKKGYFILWVKMLLSFLIAVLLSVVLINKIFFVNIFITFIIKGMCAVLFSIVIILIMFGMTDEFKYSIGIINRILRRNHD
ncbi:lipopolysaccharide biosynthesis protein [Pseudobutyrivibrio ruminis]|uniref:lipopolysaccharide biosynthesis protein n=1 Tax=Pseudobutyrivibrio ruminis TaxID=46206 RepID=UPI0004152F92|nr:oligosaccharide flippase family protein [Pseudobutyrivibrio ruminis]